MLARVIYVKGNELSEKCKDHLVGSLKQHDWNYEVVEGITPDTLNENEFPYPDLEGGRLESFRLNKDPNERKKYLIKKSCLFNNLRFARDVLDAGEPMIFLEHDVKVNAPMPKSDGVHDFCFLNIESAFKPPSALDKTYLRKWFAEHPHKLGLQPFPSDYPLRYYKDARYYGKNMVPGTSGYILTTSGAERILGAASEFGLEQSDFIYNNMTVYMQYLYPSPMKFQNVNPNLSHKL